MNLLQMIQKVMHAILCIIGPRMLFSRGLTLSSKIDLRQSNIVSLRSINIIFKMIAFVN